MQRSEMAEGMAGRAAAGRATRGRGFYALGRGAWGAGLTVAALAGCQAIGDTLGEINQFSLQDDARLGGQAYEELLTGADAVQAGPQKEMVDRVAARLIAAAQLEHPQETEFFEWQVTLVDDPETVNAFCLPGGKIAVYTGILPVTETEAGLAVVVGHEIAHATMRHGTKAMTRQWPIALLVSFAQGEYVEQGAQIAAGLVQLGFGRRAESQADEVGLRYMARAGYDPTEAIAFWGRMAELGGSAPIEFLSTHPSHETRIEDLRALMPEALELYRESGGAAGGPGDPPGS